MSAELDTCTPVQFKELYPTAHPKAVRLLEKMLRWNPSDRLSVDTALCDLYVNNYRTPDNEPVCLSPLGFDINEDTVSCSVSIIILYQFSIGNFCQSGKTILTSYDWSSKVKDNLERAYMSSY